jgi:prepilin-type processing-associated H-X9-DG protein
MGKSWGRVRTVFAVVVALAVPAALFVHSTASAYMDSQAARSAVIQALTALTGRGEGEPAPEAAERPKEGERAKEGDRPREGEKPKEGERARESRENRESERPREVGGEQRQALMKTVNSYYELLRKGNAKGAWELIHPDTYGKWTQEDWVESRSQSLEEMLQVQGPGGGSALIGLFLAGREYDVCEVATDGGSGWAHVVVRLDSPVTVALRKAGDDWAIDLAETDVVAARDSVRASLRSITPGKPVDTMMGLMLASELGVSPGSIPDLPAIDLADRSVELREATITGDRAHLALNARGAVHVAVPLQSKGGRWSVDWQSGDVKIITPETDVRGEFTGVRASSHAAMVACQSNMKQLALAAMMYCQDYDERMPIADRWCGALMPYCRNEAIFTCPADDEQWSYAMNYKLSRQPLAVVVSPASTYMLFETEPSRKDAYDKETYPGASLAAPPRHGEFNNFAFADGHVQAVAQSSVSFDCFRVVDNKGGVMEPMPGAAPPGPGAGSDAPPPGTKGSGAAGD